MISTQKSTLLNQGIHNETKKYEKILIENILKNEKAKTY